MANQAWFIIAMIIFAVAFFTVHKCERRINIEPEDQARIERRCELLKDDHTTGAEITLFEAAPFGPPRNITITLPVIFKKDKDSSLGFRESVAASNIP